MLRRVCGRGGLLRGQTGTEREVHGGRHVWRKAGQRLIRILADVQWVLRHAQLVVYAVLRDVL